MLIVYMVTALVGGLVTCVLLWPYGAAIALVSMPFGGSLFTLFAAILIYMRASDEANSSGDRTADINQLQTLQTTESR
jgi:heme A synthase